MLHSGVKFDACMECGGDGSTCTTVSDTADTHHLRNGKDNHPCTSVSTILHICQFSSPLILTQKRSKRNFITFPLVCSLFVVVMYCCNVLCNVQFVVVMYCCNVLCNVQWMSMYVHSKLYNMYVFTLRDSQLSSKKHTKFLFKKYCNRKIFEQSVFSCVDRCFRKRGERLMHCVIAGYHDLLLIPSGSTSISIRESKATASYLGMFIYKLALSFLHLFTQ